MDLSQLLIWLAVPVFLLSMGVELCVLRARRLPSYDWRDTLANLLTGLGNQIVNLPWAIAEVAILVWLYGLAPWRITGWVAWAVALVAVDLSYYWYHRSHHEVRMLWAVHVV